MHSNFFAVEAVHLLSGASWCIQLWHRGGQLPTGGPWQSVTCKWPVERVAYVAQLGLQSLRVLLGAGSAGRQLKLHRRLSWGSGWQ